MLDNAEIYVDTFSFLDRDHLEALQLCRRYFRSLVDEHMPTVCWRRIALAELKRRYVTLYCSFRSVTL